MKPRHFITLNDLSADELRAIIQRAIELKKMRADGAIYEPLKNKVLAMIFENHPPAHVFHLKPVWLNLVVPPYFYPHVIRN
jgi:ornithine carbamoyltransferase (EC 2.1.3.3)